MIISKKKYEKALEEIYMIAYRDAINICGLQGEIIADKDTYKIWVRVSEGCYVPLPAQYHHASDAKAIASRHRLMERHLEYIIDKENPSSGKH